MKNKNRYDIQIKFQEKKTAKPIFQGTIPYSGSNTSTDTLKIYNHEIILIAYRVSILNLNEIFYNHTSSLNNQIIKALVYYYAQNFKCPAIEEIIITRAGQSGVLDEKTFKSNQISQPLTHKIKSFILFKPAAIKVIFQETEKGKSILIALSYWLKAMSVSDPVEQFERLWRGFNSIYSIGMTGNETNKHIAMRDFTINNPSILVYSSKEIKKYNNDKTLRNSFRWRGLILNDYGTIAKTEAYKSFIKRYSDTRVIKLLKETLPYRVDFLTAKGYITETTNYINNCLTHPTTSDAQLISLLCIKYMYFVRNKSFHGEKLDDTFRVIGENKGVKEFNSLNILLSSYTADLINANHFL